MRIVNFVIVILSCVILVVITTLFLIFLRVDLAPWNPPYSPKKPNSTVNDTKNALEKSDFSQRDYCKVPSCGERNHTMCKYKTNFLNDKNCRSCTVYDPDRDMIHRIIQFHNIIRKTTEYGLTIGRDGPLPKAYEIPKLKWSMELAKIATRWVHQCKPYYDECRDTYEMTVGQNIGHVEGHGDLGRQILGVLKIWEASSIDLENDLVRNYRNTSQKKNDFAQMVWAKTRYVGCGYITCRKPINDTFHLVCNYGPAGNINGEPIYKVKDEK